MMNKCEKRYCLQIARMNLIFIDDFSKDFLEKVSGPVTDIIFNYMMKNNPEFVNFLQEVDLDEII